MSPTRPRRIEGHSSALTRSSVDGSSSVDDDRESGGRCAGSGSGADVVNIERLVAFAADDDSVHVVVAGRVVQHEGGALGTGEPALAPCGHRGEDRVRVAAFVGEAILVTGRVLLVLDATQQTLFHKTGEAKAEHVPPNGKFVLEVVEPAGAKAGLADEEQVPVVAEHGGAAGDGARPVGRVDAFHPISLEQWVA